MSANHTSEPWRVSGGRYIKQNFTDIGLSDDAGAIIATIPGGKTSGPFFIEDDAEISANARRIVACVNACAGISTENLEDNAPIKELARRYNEALKQRDELLAALKGLVDAGDACVDPSSLEGGDIEAMAIFAEAEATARAAIATTEA